MKLSISKFLICLTSTLACLSVFSSNLSPVYSDNEISATVIEPGVTVIETYDNTTLYLVEGDSAALIIDTGTRLSALSEKLARFTQLPIKVILTHGHYDHAGNIDFFPEVSMHKSDMSIDTQALKEYKGKLTFVEEGDLIDLGNRKLTVMHTPGHTPGSICLIDEENKIAFTGDAFGSGQLWMQLNPQLPMAVLAESCGKMIELMATGNVEKIYVGHYPYLKKPLSMDYMLDLMIACRKIDKGEISECKPFGDKALILKYGSAEIVFLPQNAGQRTIIEPYVLLKLDDVHYGEEGEAVPPRWNRLLDYIDKKNLKVNLGIIGYSLSADRPDYIQWLRKVAKRENIEFWNHGFHNRMGLDEAGEFEQDYEKQFQALHLTDSLAMAKVGIKLKAWGRHWTNCNEFTDKALSTVDDLELIFGAPESPIYYKGLVMPFNLEMEYPFHNPVYRTFLINYFGKWRNLKSFYLQGHPNSWDESRWKELEQIIERLTEDKATFISISDYISLIRNGDLKNDVLIPIADEEAVYMPYDWMHRYDDEIAGLVEKSDTDPDTECDAVFIGSSSIRLWPDLEQAMAPLNVKQRGYGGATMRDILSNLDKLMGQYRPKSIVLYCDNDICGWPEGDLKVSQVLSLYKTFISTLQRDYPDTRFFFLSIKHSLSRKNLKHLQEELNNLMKDYSEGNEAVTYVDFTSPLLDERGEVNDTLFMEDHLHLNNEGYKLWNSILKPLLVNSSK